MRARIVRFLFLLFFLSVSGMLSAEHRMPFDEFMSLVLAYLGDDDDGNVHDADELQDRLSVLYSQPLNWNVATRQQFEDMIFIPDDQIENLLFYAHEYGPVHSVYELRMVPDIDAPMLLLLPEVMCVHDIPDTVKWSDAFARTGHRLSVRSDFTAERRAAYLSVPKGYLGADFRFLTKYRFSAGNNFRAGITLETDAGEPWFSYGGRGFDMYRFYVQSTGLSYLSRIIAGSYRAGFGTGLLFGNDSYGSRILQTLNMSVSDKGISAYGGVSEAPVLCGVASSVSLGKFSVTALYGHTALDADTSGGVWSSFSSTGYHRTISELARRGTLSLHTIGGNMSYVASWYRMGLTVYGGFFSMPAVIPSGDWSVMAFTGRRQWGVSADYMLKRRGIRFSGETALTNGGAVATSNSLGIYISSDIQLVLNYRYFSPRYHAFWAKTVSSGSDVNAEHGASFALKLPVARAVSLSLFADVFKPLWSTVYTTSSFFGSELRAEMHAGIGRGIVMTATARYKLRPVWYRSGESAVAQTATDRVALVQWRIVYGKKPFGFASGIQANAARTMPLSANNMTFGCHLYQDLSYVSQRLPLSIRARLSYNYSQDWANRFYLYEYDVPESAYSPALYGNALRWYLLVSYRLPYGLGMSVRVAQALFFDRKSLSSGRDRIDAPHRTDFHVYLSWNLR